jgi:hypothetical protein
MNAAEALAEARRVYAAQAARQAEVGALAAQLAAHLKSLQENSDAVWEALTAVTENGSHATLSISRNPWNN